MTITKDQFNNAARKIFRIQNNSGGNNNIVCERIYIVPYDIITVPTE